MHEIIVVKYGVIITWQFLQNTQNRKLEACLSNLCCSFVVGMLPEGRHGLVNSLRPIRNRRHFVDDIFKCIFLNENIWILIKISLKFIPKGSINNIPALVQIMAWHQPGNKPLSEPMMIILLMHICVTWPQIINPIPSILFLLMTWGQQQPGYHQPWNWPTSLRIFWIQHLKDVFFFIKMPYKSPYSQQMILFIPSLICPLT